jgi:glycosyltransferase involved in cell wall biosynthesis
MCEISIIMPLCNHEKHVHDAVESVLNQSFKDFELILADFGSSDNALSMVRSFKDNRIRIIGRTDLYDRIHALNAGLESASGKYIAIMEADCIMHVDRLKIQHTLMEAEPSITVCGSRIKPSENQKTTNKEQKATVPGGLMEKPLPAFLRGNCMIHATAMIRKTFLTENRLHYENYPDVEGFKLFTEVAKRGGQFYVDTQTLLYCYAKEEREDERKQSSYESVINEIVQFMADTNPELSVILANFKKLKETDMMTQQDIVGFFHNFFMKNNS